MTQSFAFAAMCLDNGPKCSSQFPYALDFAVHNGVQIRIKDICLTSAKFDRASERGKLNGMMTYSGLVGLKC